MKAPGANPFVRSLLNSAVMAHKAGELDRAEAQYQQVLKSSPQEFDALSLLGTLLSQRRDFSRGLNYLRSALKLRPQSPNVLLNMGLCLQELARDAEALGVFEDGLKLRPDAPEFLRGKALALLRLKKHAEALQCHETMAAKRFCTTQDDINHGICLYELGRYDESLAKLAQAGRVDPKNAALLYNTGRCLFKLGRLDAALAALDEALKILPGDKKALIARTEALREMGNSALALETIEKVLDLEPENAFAHGLKGSLLLDLARRQEAAAIFRDLAKRNQLIGEALQNLAHCKKFTAIDEDAELILNGRNLADVHPAEKSIISFGASKCLNDLGRYEEAFAAAKEARKLRPKSPQLDYDFDAIAETFSEKFLNNHQFEGNPSEQPVFVIGMPRSGTTLIEQIIASHPQAHGAGELHDMFRIGKKLGALEATAANIRNALGLWSEDTLEKATAEYLRSLRRSQPNADRIVDKMPHNFMLAGTISILFPKARIIHSTRNAADTCVSIFMNDLKGNHGYADDLEALGEYYVRYSKLMAHWQVSLGERLFVNSYEATVRNPEAETRKLLEFIGLPWDDKCLRFFETERSVTTHSRAQVREPLYATSVERWRSYEKNLEPLLAKLRQAGLLDP
jgi:tetratricopeptide (TPR) repeat protein